MRESRLWLALLACLIGPNQLVAQAETWEPTRINKVLELLEMGQPVYYVGCGECDYDAGLELAQTTADWIDYNTEHSFTDIPRLREFMQGLVDGGPTPSGHRTPTVIVTAPAVGWSETAMRGNTHLMQYYLAAGAHGIMLTHAADPAAARVMVESIRYPFAPPVDGLAQGLRGAGSADYAAEIWGISEEEYLQRADVWPLNPEGEILLGVKIENIHAVENATFTLGVPGISYTEWSPGDNSYWMGHVLGLGAPAPATEHPETAALRDRVMQAVEVNDGFFGQGCNANNVTDLLDEGIMICIFASPEAIEIGREHTGRQMPW